MPRESAEYYQPHALTPNLTRYSPPMFIPPPPPHQQQLQRYSPLGYDSHMYNSGHHRITAQHQQLMEQQEPAVEQQESVEQGLHNKSSKRTSTLSKEQIAAHFMLPQPEAAKKLGVSLSTLKRRYYELYGQKNQRWPYVCYKRALKKTRVSHIVNRSNKETKALDPHTVHTLKMAFSRTMDQGTYIFIQ